MTDMTLPARQAQVLALVTKRLTPVLSQHMTPPQVDIYLAGVANTLLVPDPAVPNLLRAPLSVVATMLNIRGNLDPTQPIHPGLLLARYHVFATLLENLPAAAYGTVARDMLHPNHDTDVLGLVSLPMDAMLLHAKVMHKLDMSFADATQHIAAIPPSMLAELLGDPIKD